MSKIKWEYDLVERPFCEQLKAIGWQWINGDKPGLICVES
jgi:type I restriction enzyme, R subunit